MFSYDAIVTACYHAGIDPHKRGNNIKANLKPMFAGNAVNLTLIRFCDESKEVMCIGGILNCLTSQIQAGVMTLKEAKEAKLLKQIILLASTSQDFWFDKFIDASGLSKDKYCISHGIIYEIDTERKKVYDEEQKIPYAFRMFEARQE